jgi:mRNA-degrading endonuclease RelE of RelBE toxin-antitoxin system
MTYSPKTCASSPVFTGAILELLDDDAYQSLQLALLLRPQLGAVIRGSGGLRKVRWAAKGKGKRGGARVIYYWDEPTETFYMLYAYRKSAREDITDRQVRLLRRFVREEFG